MKIGIPRSLFYYYYGEFWINFLKYLDIDYIISPKTNTEIINLGSKYSNDEMCLSIKNYIGHVAYLKDKCDYILIPRIDNYGRDNQTCTNFLAIYDIINNLFDIKIINYNINYLNNETLLNDLLELSNILNRSKKQIRCAYEFAYKIVNENKNIKVLDNIKKLNSNKLKILLIGHSYNIYDELIGVPIIKYLKKYNIELIYSDLFNTKDEYKLLTPGLYFNYSKVSVSSIEICKDKIDGIIFIGVFPCGLDSLINELLIRKLNIPILNLILDDITITGGIETRLESFIDILNSKVNNK